MFYGKEMKEQAVWNNWNDAFRVMMWMRTKQYCMVVPAYNPDDPNEQIGYTIMLWNPCPDPALIDITRVTKGLMFAAMQRHDIPMPVRDENNRMPPDDAPRMDPIPILRDMPKGWMQEGLRG